MKSLRRLLLLLALGPGIRKGHISGEERRLEDVVPTLGQLMGCPVPEAQGQVMEEALEAPVLAGAASP